MLNMLIFSEAEDKRMNKQMLTNTWFLVQVTDDLRTIFHIRDYWDCKLELTEQHLDRPQTITKHCYLYLSNINKIITDYITSQLHEIHLLAEQVWMVHYFSQDGNSFCWETLQNEIKQEWRSLAFFMAFPFVLQNCITLKRSKILAGENKLYFWWLGHAKKNNFNFY